ncbi:MAG: hypothetical protein WC679_14185 [Bacteroidales bacterium]|jgi:hypothetical protein
MWNVDKKSIIDRELECYKKECENSIRESIIKLKEECADSKGAMEHKWHSEVEERKTEIARLDEEIKYKKKCLEDVAELKKNDQFVFNKLVEEKDAVIKDLREHIKFILTKLPDVNIKDISINNSCK